MALEVILATTNPGKTEQVQQLFEDLAQLELLQILNLADVSLDETSGVPEPEENGATFEENARIKAAYYGQKLQERGQAGYVLADDFGTQLAAYPDRLGVHTARAKGYYSPEELTELGLSPEDRLDRDQVQNRVFALLAQATDRSATLTDIAALAVVSDQLAVVTFAGHLQGEVTQEPVGEPHPKFAFPNIIKLDQPDIMYSQVGTPGYEYVATHREQAYLKAIHHLAVNYEPSLIQPMVSLMQKWQVAG